MSQEVRDNDPLTDWLIQYSARWQYSLVRNENKYKGRRVVNVRVRARLMAK